MQGLSLSRNVFRGRAGMLLPVTLELHDLHIHYRGVPAVVGVTLQVRRGEIVGLIGPNGSGKSTTLAAAAGVIEPHSGTVCIDGISPKHDAEWYARNVGLVPQEPALYDELSARQNLELFARLYGFHGADLAARVARGLARARLLERASHRVSSLSGGMKQRLNLAVALLHDPPVLLLDEPTAALDPPSREQLYADLHTLRADGHAIILTTHYLAEAEQGCDRVLLLERGRLIGENDRATRLGSGRVILFGNLASALPKYLERSVRQRLEPDVEWEVIGRRVRLGATSNEALGRALAVVLSAGVAIEGFRSPTGGIESLMRYRVAS